MHGDTYDFDFESRQVSRISTSADFRKPILGSGHTYPSVCAFRFVHEPLGIENVPEVIFQCALMSFLSDFSNAGFAAA